MQATEEVLEVSPEPQWGAACCDYGDAGESGRYLFKQYVTERSITDYVLLNKTGLFHSTAGSGGHAGVIWFVI